MKVTFIYHSAFLVELERCSLLFDWYGGDLPKIDFSIWDGQVLVYLGHLYSLVRQTKS